MRLLQAHIKNYRAISELTIDIDPHTVLVGANGVGKSCVLKAIEKFFTSSPTVTREDFHENNVSDPIEVTLTFSDFTAEETDKFCSRIHHGRMIVTRRMVFGGTPRDNGKYYGQTPRHLAFAQVRDTGGALPKRQAYNGLRILPDYADLPAAANDAEVNAGMDGWETSHPDQCELSLDDGQFFGFQNVGRGILQKYISFVFVPAIRDAATDSIDRGNSVVAQLIELIVKTVVQKRDDIRQWQEKASAEYSSLVNPDNLGELSDLAFSLTDTLNQFYPDTLVDLAWQPPEDFSVKLPAAGVSLTEQGYTGPVEGKGHGLQRAFIFTILQHLADAIQKANAELQVDGSPQETSHTLILAIEEPELYQHPTKQRHLARVLAAIGTGNIAGVMGQTQVLVCSHSPHFVSTERFSDVRLARRIKVTDHENTECRIYRVRPEDVCDLLNEKLQIAPEKGYQPDSLAARLHILDPLVAEGFFSTKAILVEGVGDRAALAAVGATMGVDFEAQGIAILPVNGKLNLARPLAIFSLLEIPTYVIFDSDSQNGGETASVEANLGLQRMCGCDEPVDFRTHIDMKFASFENRLEDVLESELGPAFMEQVGLASYKYGLPKNRLLKSPVSLREIVSGCLAAGSQVPTLSGIVTAIVSL